MGPFPVKDVVTALYESVYGEFAAAPESGGSLPKHFHFDAGFFQAVAALGVCVGELPTFKSTSTGKR
jgi:hypothetical protein